ncbi:hypothetical protein GE061_012465 [Apolygus lucorum]|uniref:Aspartic peptidase DDI1-type domain-containing protein n=1 Tax=Apolygus lucorum TaxID=248454 RepID=A0A8S9XUM3_APOLU|nr:hypothetical protein GE061_012465 [Apolygus lucorum]
MKLTIASPRDELLHVEVPGELMMDDFIGLCAVETGFSPSQICLVVGGKKLTKERKSIKSMGLKEDDVVIVQPVAPYNRGRVGIAIADSETSRVTVAEPERIRDLLMSNPEHMSALKQNNPRLYKALKSGQLEEFAKELNDQLTQRERTERQRLKLMQSNPFDPEAQRLIAEDIRMKNIEANMEAALEYNPETFGLVTMLYINCVVNGHPLKAFVDSGAQTTIMSESCAERVNIMRLVDTRWSGYARGVGIQKIIGRVHMVDLVIENDHLTTSFSVIEKQPMDMLLGLDMLKRHECVIDLKRNVLRIGTTGTETTFLKESDIPEDSKLWKIPKKDGKQKPSEGRQRPHSHSPSKAKRGKLIDGEDATEPIDGVPPPPPLKDPDMVKDEEIIYDKVRVFAYSPHFHSTLQAVEAFRMRNLCIFFQILGVISCVAIELSAAGLATYQFPKLKRPHGGQRSNSDNGFVSTELTPALDNMVRTGLRSMRYDPSNISVEKALTGKKEVGGRMLDCYRVSYVNRPMNQYCYFSFVVQTGVVPDGLVCNKPCVNNVCRVDSQLIQSRSYDSSYNKDWQTKQYHENKEEHRRDYIGSFQNGNGGCPTGNCQHAAPYNQYQPAAQYNPYQPIGNPGYAYSGGYRGYRGVNQLGAHGLEQNYGLDSNAASAQVGNYGNSLNLRAQRRLYQLHSKYEDY